MADLQRTVYPHKWSPVRCRSSAGQGKFAGQRPTFYRCTTHYCHCHRRQRVFSELTLPHFITSQLTHGLCGLNNRVRSNTWNRPLFHPMTRYANALSRALNHLVATSKPHSNGPSYNNTVIGTLAVDGWAVTFGTARRRLGGAAAHPGPFSLYQM